MIKTTLGQVADIITGPFGSSLHQYEYVSFGIPVIMPQDIGNRNLSYEKIAYITQEKANELSRYLVDTNDIVYARRGDIEKHAFITDNDKDAICGTGCLRVRIMDKNVNPLFLSFYLNKPETKKWISLHAVGSSMPNINSEILSKVPIVLPDKREQDSIASFLDNIDNKISNNNDICSDLESMAKLLYDYWFVQFDFPDENGKPYKSSGGKMVWNEELKREIPDGWEVKPLSEVFDITMGSSPSGESLNTEIGNQLTDALFQQVNGVGSTAQASSAMSSIAWMYYLYDMGIWEADAATVSELANKFIEMAVKYGVACCHHTCKNLDFNMKIIQASTLSPQMKELYAQILAQATLTDPLYTAPDAPIVVQALSCPLSCSPMAKISLNVTLGSCAVIVM